VKFFQIKNKLGLHARPAAKLAELSNRYKATITFEVDGEEVDAKSLLSILTLACPQGTKVKVKAYGEDAQEALEALEKLFEDKFGEA